MVNPGAAMVQKTEGNSVHLDLLAILRPKPKYRYTNIG